MDPSLRIITLAEYTVDESEMLSVEVLKRELKIRRLFFAFIVSPYRHALVFLSFSIDLIFPERLRGIQREGTTKATFQTISCRRHSDR